MVRRSAGRHWAARGASALLASALVLPLAMSGAQAQTEPPEAEPAPVEDPALDWNNYEKVLLTKNTGEPIDLAVLPDSRVLHTARNGVVRLTDPTTGATTQVAQLDVYANSEDGLQGVALDPNFEENNWVYLVYAPRVMSGTSPTGVDYPETTPAGNAPNSLPEGADPETYWDQWLGYNVLSRFQFDAEAGTLDLESEQEIIKVDAQRGQCCHVGADMAFDGDGNLYLSTGDNTPAGTPGANGYTPINNAPNMNPGFDARRGAGNTNDLRGSILRINVNDEIEEGAEPGPDSTYTIPEGNLFDTDEVDPDLVREEIYVMGVRNPFRIDYDIESGALVWGDYGPDAGARQEDRGPMGYVEWQLTTEPMNGGWPYCHGPNDGGAYDEWDYENNAPGENGFFDCDAGPTNRSTWNTGLEQLPPVTEPQVYYGDNAGDQPELLDPLTELGGGGQAPMGGPIYRFDEDLDSEVKFPEYWDGKPFMAEFSQDYVVSFTMDELSSEGEVTEVTDFLPNLHLETVNQPIWDNVMDFEFGPDGAMYVLEYGDGFFRQNPDAGLYVVNYVGEGNKTPQASFTATPASSSDAPLEVVFDASASRDPEGEELTYEWDLDGDGEYDDATGVNPTYTYDERGVYNAALRAVDPEGKAGLAIRQISVGNTAPEITLSVDDGAIFNWGDAVPVSVSVTDAEDGDEFVCNNVRWTFGLGHNEHAHPEQSGRGCEFTLQTSEDAVEHGEGEKIYGTLVVTYADQAQEDVPSITGEATLILKPEVQQAEWYDAAEGVTVVDDAEAGAGSYVELGDGSITFRPMAMTHAPTGDVIDTVTVRGAGEGTVFLTWGDAAEPFASFEFTGDGTAEKNLTAQSTINQWFADPVGGPLIREIVPAEAASQIGETRLEDLVELSQGAFSGHALAELIEAYNNAPAAPGEGGWQDVETRLTEIPEGAGEIVVTSTGGVDLDSLTFTASGEQPPVENIRIPAEKVSIGMFSLTPWLGEDGLPSVLARLAEIGFENVEPFGSNFNGYTAEEFRTMVDEIGLNVPSSHYNVREDTFDETLAYVETLGQEYVGSGGFAAPGIGSYEDTLATAATMNRLGQRSVEAGIGKFFGHNHDGEFTTRYEHNGEQMSAWEILVEQTNPEYVTFQLDVAWAAHAGIDVPALIEEHGDRIELLHVKDAVNVAGEGRPTFTNLGEGEVPLQEILRAAEEHANIAYYVLEYDRAPHGETFAETGFSYLTGEELAPIRVETEDVSIGMFSLIPWVNTDGLPSVLARLAEIGFENVEPFGSNFNGYTAEQFRAMVDLIGLKVPSSHYNVAEGTFGQTLEYISTLGQEYAGSGGFPQPGISSYGKVLQTADAMNRLGRLSVEAGVGKLFGHNHATEFTTVYEHGGEEMSAWEILVDLTDPQYVTFQLDVAWAAHAGVDVPALIEEHGDRIELLHVKDATGLGGATNPTFTNLGEGDVPLQDILRAARDHANIALYVLEYDVAPLGENFAETGFEYLTGQAAGEEGSRPVEVTPAAVTFTDEYGTDADTFTVPRSTGVVYLVDGAVVAPGTYPGTGTVTVTAQAVEGFVLADGAVTQWSHTFSTAGAPAPDRRTAEFHLSNTWRGSTDVHFMYGRWADEVLIGDWDGDGRDTIAVRKGNEFHVSNSQRGGNPDSVFTYGRPGDVILVGDWDGDGQDTFAVRRGAVYHVKNTLRGGPADVSFTYGRADDQVLVGDWNGNDVDTLAIRRGATYHVKNSVIGGDADVVFTYGRANDVTLAGDWDGDGADTFALQRGRTYHVTNSLRGGDADTVVTFGRLGDEVYVGDWNGDGTDTLGIRRPVGGAASAKAIGSMSKIG